MLTAPDLSEKESQFQHVMTTVLWRVQALRVESGACSGP